MPTETKEIRDRTMSREKPLGLAWGFKLAHLTFPLPCWLMRDFGAVVKARALPVRHTGQALSAGSPITAKLIGHQQAGYILQPFQQLAKEAFCGVFVPPLLHENIQDLAILVHSPPQIVALPTNRDKYLIEMPGVAKPPPSMPKLVRENLAELQTPLAYSLIANGDPALS
jgi:hypothetical protein